MFILPLLDLSIASNLYDSVINLLTIQSINVEKEHIKLKKLTYHQSMSNLWINYRNISNLLKDIIKSYSTKYNFLSKSRIIYYYCLNSLLEKVDIKFLNIELQNRVKINSHSSAFVSKMAPKSIYQIGHTIILSVNIKFVQQSTKNS